MRTRTFAAVKVAILLASLAIAGRLALHVAASDSGSRKTGFVTVGGGRLYYEEAGEGCPVVLIGGGGGMDLRQWDGQFDALSREFRTIRYDPRGDGKSDMPERPFSYAEDLNALLEALGIEQAALIGVSSGSGIALEFAALYPNKVWALVPAAPFVNGYPFSEGMQKRVDAFAAAAQKGAEALIAALFSDPHFMPAPENPQARERAKKLMAENFTGFDASLIKQLDPPTAEQVARIQAPTLLLVGELDHPDLHGRVEFLQTRIRGSKKMMLKNAGHMVNMETPRAFARSAKGFLRAKNCGVE